MESMDQWRGIALASQEMSATAECLPLAIGNALPRTRQLNISVVGGLFEFETNPCIFGGQRFFSKYWPICFPITLLYLFMIYTGQRFMKNRKPIDLHYSLILWNAGLGLFSAFAAFRGIVFIAGDWYNEGFYFATCASVLGKSFCPNCSFIKFWGMVFGWSKILEFGDTVFLILRKRPVIFLHWYHHITVMWFSWYSLATDFPAAKWFCAMNYLVHAFMYSYYAFRAAGFHVPRVLAMALTLIQIVQMILGCFFIAYTHYANTNYPTGCGGNLSHVLFGTAIYSSYWFLFCWFFYKTYLGPQSRRPAKPKSSMVNGKPGTKEHETQLITDIRFNESSLGKTLFTQETVDTLRKRIS